MDAAGYGYDKGQRELLANWAELLSTYQQSRVSLFGKVLIMDARHPLTPLDEQMLGWFASTRKPVHVLLSKSDKLTRQEQQKTLREVRARLRAYAPNYGAQLFSSLKKQGMEEAEEVIGAWLGVERSDKKIAPGQRGMKPGARTP